MPSFPTFVINGKGERRGIDWSFNAWGGEVDDLYPSWENDNRVARKFCDLIGNDVYDKRDFICEGSLIHADGENETQPFAFFAMRRSFFFVFSRYLEALI